MSVLSVHGRAATEVKAAVIEHADIHAHSGSILFHILHGSRWVILGEKDILVTARRKSEVVEHDSQAAIGKTTNITVTTLVNAY